MNLTEDSIVAISTPPGMGALGVIRISGPEALRIASAVFSKDLMQAQGYSVHFGRILKGEEVLDEALATVFRAPRSFTREDVVEFSCHGSPYILREVMQLLVEQGARLAEAGEFTQRAFLNGAMDLAQAEAVADLIASHSAGAHHLAMNQMRGGVSRELKELRGQLLHFTSLIELELDFAEEDVEFADRSQLKALVQQILNHTEQLIGSFSLGNAIKQGVPTVIMGKPNAGKSTLLNTLLNENRAIVSDIAGTTRDVIEDRLVIQGIEFRLMDTAGVRETADVIEAEGVSRTLALAQTASLVLYLFDIQTETPEEAQAYVNSLDLPASAHILLLANKTDLVSSGFRVSSLESKLNPSNPKPETLNLLYLSAKTHSGIDTLRHKMVEAVHHFSANTPDQAIISNVRHLNALRQARQHLLEVIEALDSGLPSDLMSIDIRAAIHHIGEITGEITTDEVLGNIFEKFCIGK